MLETELKDLAKRINATIVQGQNKHFELLETQLKEYFDAREKVFNVPLFTPGTDFQKMVWAELQTIPFGKTRSYLEQAKAIRKTG